LAVILVLCAIVVLIVSVIRVELALLLLVGLIPLEFAFNISDNPQITTVKLAGAACFVGFAVNTLGTRKRLAFDWTHVVLFLLVALGIVSSLQARSVGDGFAITMRYASFISLYVIITQLLAENRLHERIVWVLSIACAVSAVLAIQNFLAGTALLARPHYGADPLDLAFILATTLPLTFWLLRSRGSQRGVVLLMLGLISAGVILTFARGAILALAAGAVWHALTERRHIPVIAVGLAVGLATAALLILTNESTVLSGLRLKGYIADANVQSRFDSWAAAEEMVWTHPLVGVGPGNFRFYYRDLTGAMPEAFRVLVVHNAYLDIAAELGLIGLALWISYLSASFWRATKCVRLGKGPPGLVAALRTALIVAVVGMVTLSEQYTGPVWIIGGLITAIWTQKSDPSTGNRQ
jgi:O-antigen ligase